MAGIAGAFGIVFSAAAAHGLEAALPTDRVGWIETGARFAMIHAAALLGVAWLADARGGAAVLGAGLGFGGGVLLFCGGLIAAGLTGWTGIMPVVPLGGGAFILGWLLISVAALRPRWGDNADKGHGKGTGGDD